MALFGLSALFFYILYEILIEKCRDPKNVESGRGTGAIDLPRSILLLFYIGIVIIEISRCTHTWFV